jgi:aspartyl protease family protein
MIGWALRWVLLCCGMVLLGVGILDRGAALPPDRAAPSGPETRGPGPGSNALVYAANERGHFILEAAVNGAPIRLLVDTGASMVALAPEDARAAGIDPRALVFNGLVNTANGTARMAAVT